MQQIIVSSCLLGEPARYDGSLHVHEHEVLKRWIAEGRVVSVCPETAGGLPVPRPAAEMNPALPPLTLNDGQTIARVVDASGKDFTAEFVSGAEKIVSLAREKGIRVAVLKERSPSCGSSIIYDGSFKSCQVPGEGVATQRLRQAGIKVFSEEQLAEADKYLRHLIPFPNYL